MTAKAGADFTAVVKSSPEIVIRRRFPVRRTKGKMKMVLKSGGSGVETQADFSAGSFETAAIANSLQTLSQLNGGLCNFKQEQSSYYVITTLVRIFEVHIIPVMRIF